MLTGQLARYVKMRELVLENAGGKWKPSQEASCILLVGKELVCPRQPFPKRCEAWKCKDRARLEEGSRA